MTTVLENCSKGNMAREEEMTASDPSVGVFSCFTVFAEHGEKLYGNTGPRPPHSPK